MNIFSMILMISFYGNSAFPFRAEGVAGNPASLGFTPGFELLLESRSAEKDISLLAGFYGIGVSLTDSTKTFHYATGFKIADGTFIGFGLSRGDNYAFRAGVIKRIGTILTFNTYIRASEDDYVVRGGTGVRLLGGIARIYANISYSDSIEDYGGGLIFEPIKGMQFAFDMNRSGELGIGLRVFSSNFGLGYRGRENSSDYSLIVSSETYPSRISLPKKRKVELTLKGSYPEVGKMRFLRRQTSFFDLLRQFESLEKDVFVKEILIKLENPKLTYNQAEELRKEVERLKFRGKKVYFFSSIYNPITYYLASAGSKVFIQTMGGVLIPGFVATKFYFLDLMKKLGVEAEMYHIKEYKSAVEPFTRSNISEYDSIQTEELLKDFLSDFLARVSKSRKISEDSLRRLMDEIGYFNSEQALKYGLVDSILHQTDLEEQEFAEYGTRRYVDEGWVKPVIAVLTAEGSIVNGESSDGILGKTIGSLTMVKVIRELRENRHVKAVVFRINSGGGDAIASEMIWQELMKLRKEKPLVVSMGWLAASGGYYIAAPGNLIYADNNTITGSIGILGGKLVFKEFTEKIGVNTKILKTNKLADEYSLFRKFSPRGWEILEKELQWGYDMFISRVSECRGISKDSVNVIGRGRIWSGRRAKEIGLVDRIGGLSEAIREAAKLAGIKGDFEVKVYPERRFSFNLPGAGISTYMNLLTAPYLYMMPYKLELN